jgi:hypothetical protein
MFHVTDGTPTDYVGVTITKEILQNALKWLDPNFESEKENVLDLAVEYFAMLSELIKPDSTDDMLQFICSHEWPPGSRTEEESTHNAPIGNCRAFLQHWIPRMTLVILNPFDGIHRTIACKNLFCGTVPVIQPPDPDMEKYVLEYSRDSFHLKCQITMNLQFAEVNHEEITSLRELSAKAQFDGDSAVGHGMFELLDLILDEAHNNHNVNPLILLNKGSGFQQLLQMKHWELHQKNTTRLLQAVHRREIVNLFRPLFLPRAAGNHGMADQLANETIVEIESHLSHGPCRPEDFITPFLNVWLGEVVHSIIRSFKTVEESVKTQHLVDRKSFFKQENPGPIYKLPHSVWMDMFWKRIKDTNAPKVEKDKPKTGSTIKKYSFKDGVHGEAILECLNVITLSSNCMSSWIKSNFDSATLFGENRYDHNSFGRWKPDGVEMILLVVYSFISLGAKRSIFDLSSAKDTHHRQVSIPTVQDEKKFITLITQCIANSCYFSLNAWNQFFTSAASSQRGTQTRCKNIPKTAQLVCLLHSAIMDVTQPMIELGIMPIPPEWFKRIVIPRHVMCPITLSELDTKSPDQGQSTSTFESLKKDLKYLDICNNGTIGNYTMYLLVSFCILMNSVDQKNKELLESLLQPSILGHFCPKVKTKNQPIDPTTNGILHFYRSLVKSPENSYYWMTPEIDPSKLLDMYKDGDKLSHIIEECETLVVPLCQPESTMKDLIANKDPTQAKYYTCNFKQFVTHVEHTPLHFQGGMFSLLRLYMDTLRVKGEEKEEKERKKEEKKEQKQGKKRDHEVVNLFCVLLLFCIFVVFLSNQVCNFGPFFE